MSHGYVNKKDSYLDTSADYIRYSSVDCRTANKFPEDTYLVKTKKGAG